MSHLRSITIALLLVLSLAASALPEQNPEGRPSLPQGGERLPEGKARVLILEGCVQCHDLRNTVSQRKTLAGWRRTVSEMIWRGAPLTAEEAITITNYLAGSFGSEMPKADAPKTQQREDPAADHFVLPKLRRLRARTDVLEDTMRSQHKKQRLLVRFLEQVRSRLDVVLPLSGSVLMFDGDGRCLNCPSSRDN